MRGTSLRDVLSDPEAFRERFGVGEPGQPVYPVDIAGVAFASLQALYELHKTNESTIAELQDEVASLRSLITSQRRGA